jgi:hypothetical protein
MSSMTATATTATDKQYEIPPSGQQAAVLIGVIDLGTHEQESQANDGTKSFWDRRSVLLVWELTDCKMTGMKNQNHVIAQEYTVSFSNKANLRKLIEGWSGNKFKDGDQFDVETLLVPKPGAKPVGKPCVVNVVHGKTAKNKDYAKVDGVAKPMKGVTIPPAQNEPLVFDILDPKQEIPAALWIPFVYGAKHSDLIKSSKEWKNGRKPLPKKDEAPAEPDNSPAPDDGGEIPF